MGRFVQRAKRRIAAVLLGFGLVFGVLSNCQGNLDRVEPLFDAPLDRAVPVGEVTVQFLGNTNLLFSDGNTSILIDGWFTRPGMLKTALQRIEPDVTAIRKALDSAQVDTLAAVIPLHSHYDHAMDSPIVASLKKARLVGSRSTRHIAEGVALYNEAQGAPFKADFSELTAEPNLVGNVLGQDGTLEIGRPIAIGAFNVTMIESKHGKIPKFAETKDRNGGDALTAPLIPPARRNDYKQGVAFTILVEHSGRRALVQGSTGFLEDGLAGVTAEVVFLGIGGIMRTDNPYREKYWCSVVRRVQAQTVYPVHWDSLTHELSDTPELPNLLMDQLGGLKAVKSIEWVASKGQQDAVRVALMPMWDKVAVFKKRETVALKGLDAVSQPTECEGK